MMFGRVDEVDGNFVATKFVALTVPTECLYIPHGGMRTTTSGGMMPLRRSWRSVALAYGRVWLPVFAIVSAILDVLRGGPHIVVISVSVVMLALSALAHRLGRLSEGEKARLRLLGTITGLRVHPSMLRPATREKKRAALGVLMEKAGIPANVETIVSLIDDIPHPAMPLVYGYACYAGDEPEWHNCAELVYQRHEQGNI